MIQKLFCLLVFCLLEGVNVAGDILQLIATETYGESYKAHKIELDLETDTASRIESRY